MNKKPSLLLRIFGFLLHLAASLGMIFFTLVAFYGITDPEEMDLGVRLGAVIFILLLDAACFGLAVLGYKCMSGFSPKAADKTAVHPQPSAPKQHTRCPECGATLRGETGKRVKCPYCGVKVLF